MAFQRPSPFGKSPQTPPQLDGPKIVEAIVGAYEFAIGLWKLQAGFERLTIMASTAVGKPGCLKGLTLENPMKISPKANQLRGDARKVLEAAAKGISTSFKAWQDKVTVPGLPWYPAFAAWPGPQAPPTLNVPMPLITCTSANQAKMVIPQTLKTAMVGKLESTIKRRYPKQGEAILEAAAQQVALKFLIWTSSQQITQVKGYGPVPTFAPPYVPVGPVVNGTNQPGKHFTT